MSFVEFLIEYYIYILAVIIVLVIGVIGFLVDSRNKDKKSKQDNSNNVIKNDGNGSQNGVSSLDNKEEVKSLDNVVLTQNTSLDNTLNSNINGVNSNLSNAGLVSPIVDNTNNNVNSNDSILNSQVNLSNQVLSSVEPSSVNNNNVNINNLGNSLNVEPVLANSMMNTNQEPVMEQVSRPVQSQVLEPVNPVNLVTPVMPASSIPQASSANNYNPTSVNPSNVNVGLNTNQVPNSANGMINSNNNMQSNMNMSTQVGRPTLTNVQMIQPNLNNNQNSNMSSVNQMSNVNQSNLQNNNMIQQTAQPVNNVVTSNGREPFDVSSMFENNN